MHSFQQATHSYTYEEFVALTERLVEEGRTTGPDQSKEMVHYTKLNLHRMRRWNRIFKPSDDLVSMLRGRPQSWWAITEPWCGDSAQSLPILGLVAEAAGVPFRIVLRDDNLGIMDQYLTGSSRSIPIFVSFDAEGEEIFRWGPRPAEAQEIVLGWKRNPESMTYEEVKEKIHTWYARNKGEAVQKELIAALTNA